MDNPLLQSDQAREWRELPPMTRQEKASVTYWFVVVLCSWLPNAAIFCFGSVTFSMSFIPSAMYAAGISPFSFALFGIFLAGIAVINVLSCLRRPWKSQIGFVVFAALGNMSLLLIALGILLEALEENDPLPAIFFGSVFGATSILSMSAIATSRIVYGTIRNIEQS
jgi:hypothetical protein